MHAAAVLPITIRVPRAAPLEKAQEVALQSAHEMLPASAVKGCYLKTIEANAAVLVLSVQPPDGASVDGVRAKLLIALARRFSESGLEGSHDQRATFS
jgi:hypothetical protein